MEFVYDETATATSEDVKVTEHDNKTDEAFQKFEEQVDQQYQKTATVIKEFIKDNEVLSKIKLPKDLEGKVANKAEEVLNKMRLDQNLSNVEEKAQEYWSTFSKGSFWSSMANSLSQQFAGNIDLKQDNPDTPGEKDSEKIAADQSNMKNVSLDPAFYLNFDKAELDGQFILEPYVKEITDLLENNRPLADIHAELVPTNLSESDFWNIYFTKSEVRSMKSKKLDLLKIKEDHENQKRIGWDDEEDEEEAIIPSTSVLAEKKGSESPSSLKPTTSGLSNNGERYEQNKDHTEGGKHEEKTDAEIEEEEDDDWE